MSENLGDNHKQEGVEEKSGDEPQPTPNNPSQGEVSRSPGLRSGHNPLEWISRFFRMPVTAYRIIRGSFGSFFAGMRNSISSKLLSWVTLPEVPLSIHLILKTITSYQLGQGSFTNGTAAFQQLSKIYDQCSLLLDNTGMLGPGANAFKQAHENFKSMKEILFDDLGLGFDAPFYEQFSEAQKKILMDVMEVQRGQLIAFFRSLRGTETVADIKDRIQEIITNSNENLKDVARGLLLASPAMQRLEVVEKAQFLKQFMRFDFHLDAGIRKRIMKKMPNEFPPPESSAAESDSQDKGKGKHAESDSQDKEKGKHAEHDPSLTKCPNCSHCFTSPKAAASSAGDSSSHQAEGEALSGEYDDDVDDSDFITFPGQLEGTFPVKPLIDTGGGINLILKSWLDTHGIKPPEPAETVKLLNADGTTSQSLPIIRLRWKYNDRPYTWEKVKFVIIDHGPEALLGLPFLKHTKVIHNAQGQLIFPEFEKIPSPSSDGAVPIYHVTKDGPQKS